jgi:hypothetical protein
MTNTGISRGGGFFPTIARLKRPAKHASETPGQRSSVGIPVASASDVSIVLLFSSAIAVT